MVALRPADGGRGAAGPRRPRRRDPARDRRELRARQRSPRGHQVRQAHPLPELRLRGLQGEPLPGPKLPIAFPNKDSARLLFAVVGETDLTGALWLDVGCGRGGNVWLLSRSYELAHAVGVDLTRGSVAFATSTVAPGVVGVADAQRLPFTDGAFDVVTNVESSCRYPDIERFYREVARVLRPGGSFLYTDLFQEHLFPACRGALVALGLEIVSEQDVTPNVARSGCDPSRAPEAGVRRVAGRPGWGRCGLRGVGGRGGLRAARRGSSTAPGATPCCASAAPMRRCPRAESSARRRPPSAARRRGAGRRGAHGRRRRLTSLPCSSAPSSTWRSSCRSSWSSAG